MVEKVVLEYLRVNRGNYPLPDLNQKILSAGYSQEDIDEALAVLRTQSSGNAPSVSSTINRINKTNIPAGNSGGSIESTYTGEEPQPKKSKKWSWILIAVLASILVLMVAGFSIWWFFLK